MNTKKSIGIINKLIELHQDRHHCYADSINKTNDPEIRGIFTAFKETSEHCIAELNEEKNHLNDNLSELLNDRSEFLKIINEMENAFLNQETKYILGLCNSGEDITLQTYNDVLTNEIDFLTIEQHKMLYKQYVSLKEDHDKIKTLNDLQLTES